MSEFDDLLVSVAKAIATYRHGEIAQPNPEHILRWVTQFSPENQLMLLKEFNHVIEQHFVTEENIRDFLQGLTKNTKLAGNDSGTYWSKAHVLDIQKRGQSQTGMRKVLASALQGSLGVNLGAGQEGGDYIYLDDVIFSGNRVITDLTEWIANVAPQQASIQIIVAVTYSGGEWNLKTKLNKAIKDSGKAITFELWRLHTLENRKYHKNQSSVLWPTAIPAAPEVQAYMALPSKYPYEPRQPIATVASPFSSEQGRQVLESEFLIAGAKIRAKSDNQKPSMRPLGFSPFGVGFGSTIATYRNCPNNCPLALWWGDPDATSGPLNWYPLLPRKGYNTMENLLKEFNVIEE